jgi:hypothetical protein
MATHEHHYQRQTLRHDHPGGDYAHGYFEHPEDGYPYPVSWNNTATVRFHSSDDMTGLHELADITEPVAVVIRSDGTADVYGYVAVIDQRPEFAPPA